jgi:hypothetical protein
MGNGKYPAKKIEPKNGEKEDRKKGPGLLFIISNKGEKQKHYGRSDHQG